MSFFMATFAACRSQRSKHRVVFRYYNSQPKERVYNLSRTERRSIMRKQKNRDRRQAGNSKANANHTFANEESVFNRRLVNKILSFIHPKVPSGGNVDFTRQHLKPLLYRVPFATVLFLLVTNDEHFPYRIQGSIGPSMIPTIHYIGDLWLIETWAWNRLFGQHVDLAVGDVIIWKDPNTQTLSCKRLIGLEGDTVKRFGQYVHLYKDREDLGIAVPTDLESRNISFDWDLVEESKGKNIYRTVVIPPGHVWVEGDCPPFSLDSRHYGSIPKDWIKGRLLYRIWPLLKADENESQIPFRVTQKRPTPFPSIDDYFGWRFNFHKVPKKPKGDAS